ncbi:MAG: threonine synthase [Rhodobacterales bacterium CG15_BIG_FIL_POST_REV_8_21_14_020_59_13]|nr:MAG: threonine synthase [Rhodobacterales bacterium CG15_BIG_FIL_POST_REV_8_21_14_020_59_13]
MKFRSTRNIAPAASLSEAICAGQAADGGLFMPETLPAEAVQGAEAASDLASFAAGFLAPFFEGDVLEESLASICTEAFDFPLAEIGLEDGLSVLELFHGPTGAFKDFGARFLMACLDRLGDPAAPFTVLAATSGDTGGAVGCAAEGRSALRAVILYPDGRVSPFQAHQLSCWDTPVTTLKVNADFDSCQKLVKSAFSDRNLTRRHRLTSANSINIARLLPQAAYLAFTTVRHQAQTGETPGLIIPSGNLGHGVAALIARACGAPIRTVVLATNANATLHDWARSGLYMPRPSVVTIANAMDVGTPSNFERLEAGHLDVSGLIVERVDDDAIRNRIKADHARFGYTWCPHSACGAEAYARLCQARLGRNWLIAATAHPYKFADIVEPVIGEAIKPPATLSAVLDRPMRAEDCDADLAALTAYLDL